MRAAQKKAWASRRVNGTDKPSQTRSVPHLNGVSTAATSEIALVTHRTHPKQLVRESVRALAIEGAKVRLVQLDQEREILQMFIHGGKK